MGHHSSDSDDDTRSHRKKKHRRRSTSSSSSESRTFIRKKSSRRTRSHSRVRRSHSRSKDRRHRRRSSSSSSYEKRKKLSSHSRSRDRGKSYRSRRSRSRIRNRSSRSRHRHRSHSRSSECSSRRRSYSRSRSRGRDRHKGRDKGRDKVRGKEKESRSDKKGDCGDIKVGLEHLVGNCIQMNEHVLTYDYKARFEVHPPSKLSTTHLGLWTYWQAFNLQYVLYCQHGSHKNDGGSILNCQKKYVSENPLRNRQKQDCSWSSRLLNPEDKPSESQDSHSKKLSAGEAQQDEQHQCGENELSMFQIMHDLCHLYLRLLMHQHIKQDLHLGPEETAKADEVLKAKERKEEDARKKKEQETTIEEQVKRVKCIEAIESEFFVQQAFRSNRDVKKTQEPTEAKHETAVLSNRATDFNIEIKQEVDYVPSAIKYQDDDSVAHPSLFMDKKEAEEKWFKRLIILRQVKLMGSPVSGF